MKIVLFDYVFETGKPGITGLSDLVWNWAKYLMELGEEVHIVAPYPPGTQPPSGSIVHIYPIPPIGYRNVIGYILIVIRGWLEIRKLELVDIIHAPEYLSTSIFSLLSREVPIVLTVPGNIHERIKNGNPFDWFTTQLYKIAAYLSARNCTAIIVTSKIMQDWWEKTGTPMTRMKLIPYGVDTTRFRPVSEARHLLNFSDNQEIVLYVGRLSHEKGVHLLIAAIQHVNNSIQNVELHIVGDGPMRENLIDLSKILNIEERVIFHGWVDQHKLALYYSAADVTVLPSFTEGLPRTMIEAMACGSPFLGTKITGIVDHIKDGETGYLVAPGDSAELAKKLIYILSRERVLIKEVGLNGQRYVRQNLDWRIIIQHVQNEIYAKIALK